MVLAIMLQTRVLSPERLRTSFYFTRITFYFTNVLQSSMSSKIPLPIVTFEFGIAMNAY